MLGRRQILVLMVVSPMLFLPGVFAGTYSGGTGEPNDPYLIATGEDMNEIGASPTDWDRHFLLVADISLAAYTGTQFDIIGRYFGWNDTKNRPFVGVFDGSGHIIRNFTYDCSSNSAIGLFGSVGVAGEIKGLSMENVSVDANDSEYVGGLVGRNSGRVLNCRLVGHVSGGLRVGGLVGCNIGGLVSGCRTAGYVNADYSAGGLLGNNDGGTLSRCTSVVFVSGSGSIGGLVGDNNGGTISNSNARGVVSAQDSVGGFVGMSSHGSISFCYATTQVLGTGCFIGGLVGNNYFSEVSDCYATGDVNGVHDGVGGLAGGNSGIIARSYAAGNVSSRDFAGGLVGVSYDGGTDVASFWDIETTGQAISDGGMGKTTAEMKKEHTFTDAAWDFVEIWNIGENQTYPFLRTHQAGDIDHDDIVDFSDLAILAEHWLQSTQ